MNDSSEVKLHFLDYWRVVKVRWAIVSITFMLVMISAAVTCYFLPRQYYSRVIMEVKPDGSGFQIFSAETGLRNDTGRNIQPTQAQIIQRKEILYPVIDNLKLTEAWAPVAGQKIAREEAYEQLRDDRNRHVVQRAPGSREHLQHDRRRLPGQAQE